MASEQRRDPRPYGYDVRVTPVHKGHIRGRLVKRSSRKQARIEEQARQRGIDATTGDLKPRFGEPGSHFQSLSQEALFEKMRKEQGR